MSNLLTVEATTLEAVTGGTTTTPRTTPRTTACTTNDTLLNTLNGLSSTIQNLNNAASKTGFSTTDLLMLGILMSQRPAVNVFVRRPFW
ncbi:MAG: hypothetical protein E6J90_27675 [Deltaproteobacteria bacterium]|nr:MAG: hypothetical protein E6J90_27675 [Deltaproteobacteria bacterium]